MNGRKRRTRRYSNRVQAWRERRMFTQRELAARTGLTFQTIQNVEKGYTRPRFGTMRKLCEALGVERDDLFDPPEEEGRPP